MPRVNKTRYALLGFLSMQPASGYAIKKMMAQTTQHFWREGDSSIYPIFKQLLAEGMVVCESTASEGGKAKKIYSITEQGREQLIAWLYEAPETTKGRNELLLKLFFGWHVERDVMIGHLQQCRSKVAVVLDRYRTMADKTTDVSQLSNAQLHRFLTLRAGVMYSETSLAWCDEAMELLQHATK